MFKHKVQKFIEEKALFTLQDKVLVALSGGADSVALLRVLLSLGYTCECMHCNFHLRGEESDRDEAFVKALCEEFTVLLHVTHFDTETYAKEHHQSIEMAARELRYAWFHQLKEERKASVIAVAHHRDDSVETFLLNLMRGTGIDGLKGIPVRNGYVVRPLIQESREDILDYLKAIHQDYVTDSTNLQDQYVRNKIRLNILPMMKEINPSVMESIQDTAFRLSEVASIYHQDRDNRLEQILKKNSDDFIQVSIADVLNDIAPNALLHELLSPLGYNSDQVKDIYRSLEHSQSGKRFLSKEWVLIRDREDLLLHRIKEEETIPELIVQEVDYTPGFIIPREKCIACVDADKVKMPLTIRKWQVGDKFVPFGMTGKKKVSDYLTDRKMSLYQKDNQYVVCSGDHIVWIVNERSDNRFRITPHTKRVFLIQIKKDGE